MISGLKNSRLTLKWVELLLVVRQIIWGGPHDILRLRFMLLHFLAISIIVEKVRWEVLPLVDSFNDHSVSFTFVVTIGGRVFSNCSRN